VRKACVHNQGWTPIGTRTDGYFVYTTYVCNAGCGATKEECTGHSVQNLNQQIARHGRGR